MALDLVSRADVFADLLPRLAQGYALDALGATDADAAIPIARRPSSTPPCSRPRADLPTPGLGRGLRIVAPGVVGSGLEHDDELIQLCAFPAEETPGAARTDGAPPRPPLAPAP